MTQELRILLLEDVPADAELEIRELKRAGLHVAHRMAETEEGFQEALRDFKPDIILSDFSMPHFDGMWALSLAHELVPDVPFIFVSGTIGEEYAIRALKNGATDYVLKNNLVRLPAAVERALREARDASARRRAEAQLHLQGAALDAAVNAIVITDRDGSIRWVNRAFSTLTGYSAEEAVGQNPRLLKSGLHGPEFYRTMFDTILDGSTWRGEIVNRYKDGRLTTEEMTITPVRDPGGEITNFIAIKQDITARKEAEKHRARLSAILEASPDFVATADPNRRVLYLNSAARSLLELPENADLSQIEMGATHPEWAAEMVLKIGIPAAMRDGVWTGETAFLTPSGREIPVIQVILAQKGPDGTVEFISTIARDISERKSQELRIGRLNRILSVLSGINSAIVRIRDRQKLFEEACRIAVEDGGFTIAWIGAFDAKKFEMVPVASAGLAEGDPLRTTVSRGTGIIGRAMRERRPVYDNDITADPGGGGERRREAIRRGFHSVIVLPFIVDGAVVGNFSLFAKEPNFFDDEEVRLLTELADDISYALENIERQQQIGKLSRIRMVSSEINAAIVRIRDREKLLQETCRIAAEHGKFEMIWIGTADVEKKEIRPVVWRGFSQEIAQRVSWTSIHAAKGMLLDAVQTRKLSFRNDIESGLAAGGMQAEALKQGCGSTVCLPFLVDDRVVALVAIFAAGKDFFDEDELALLGEVAGDVSLALQAIARQEQVEYLSYYNASTRLPNRTLFQDRLGQRIGAARDEEQSFSVMMLDIERFRLVNETYGRQVGDELLRAIGRCLKRVLQGADLLAHLGGNQFAIATHRAEGPGDIAHALEQVTTSLSAQPFDAGGNEVQVAAKAGVAVYPTDGVDAESLLRNAEAALNDAKRTGQHYLFYASQMNARVAEQLKLENELRRAVREEQFVLHYQPRVELSGGRVTGLEALIRWMHPERGLVPPGEFISVLEDTGLILEVGRWALRRAALDHVAWCTVGLTPPPIAVNVSQAQLRRKDFVDHVRDALAGIDNAAARVDVEITESMLMEDVGGCIEKLEAVRSVGHSIAIDDFGTGYSSLSYLARLPIDSLKIDRSFITQMSKGPEQMAIVSTVISLARALNLKVVAEGVETEEQANLLRLLRCDEAQGYLYARPMPPEKVAEFLRPG